MVPNANQYRMLEAIRDGREAYCICNMIYLRLLPEEIEAGCQAKTGIALSLHELWAMKDAGWIESVKATKDCVHCRYACFFFEPSFTVPQFWHQMPYRITPTGSALLNRASVNGHEAQPVGYRAQ